MAVEDCREGVQLVRAVYGQPRGNVGCCLHVISDDGNTNDDSAAFCVDLARERGHEVCERAAQFLLRCSQTQRRKVVAMAHGLDRADLSDELAPSHLS